MSQCMSTALATACSTTLPLEGTIVELAKSTWLTQIARVTFTQPSSSLSLQR